MNELALLLIASALGFGVSRWLRLPVIPILILLGFVFTQLFAPVLEREFLEQALVMGLSFLVFAAGIEMDPRRVGKQTGAALRVGAVQFVVLGMSGIGLAALLGFDWTTSFYIGLALSASSTLVVVRLLIGRQQLFEPFGRLLIGVLLLQDVIIILLIVYLVAWPQGTTELLRSTAGIATLSAAVIISIRWIVPWIIRHFEHEEEIFLLATLSLLFTFIAIAHLFNIPLIAGAFAAGVSLSPFPSSGLVRGLFNSISDFFTAMFFTALGAIIMIPSLGDSLRAIAFVALMIIFTPLVVILVAEKNKLTARNAIESGILLAQSSEFSIIVALHGLMIAHISVEVFSIIALVTTITMILTPFLSNSRVVDQLLRLHPSHDSNATQLRDLSGHVVILGGGQTGQALVPHLTVAQIPTVLIDHDPTVVDAFCAQGVFSLWGEADDPEILRQASITKAKAVIILTRNIAHARTVQSITGKDVPVMAHVFEDVQAEQLRACGVIPIAYPQRSQENFMAWFERHF